MLKRAQGMVLCDLFPGPFSLLADSLSETAARGAHVICRVYEEELPAPTGEKLDYITLLEFRPLGLETLYKLYNSEPKK